MTAPLLLTLVLLVTPSAASAPVVEPVALSYGQAPAKPLDGPRGIALDARRGEIVIANTGAHVVETYGLDGRLRARFVHRVRTAGKRIEPGVPTGVALDASGNLLVVDRLAAYVDVLDARGAEVARLEIGAAGCPAGASVSAVAVTRTGGILVASAGDSARVHRFDGRYRSLGCWGTPGREPGQLAGITGIAALADGRCVITCATTRLAVQIFTFDGEFVRGFGAHEIGPGNFSYPSGVTATDDGRIWVSDEIRHSVQVFDSAGSYLGVVGGQGVAPGEFMYPSALSGDGKELLAVSERVGNRYQLLRIR